MRRRITRKTVGEVGGLQFMARAATMRFTVAKPHGDSEAYDVLVDNGRPRWRVQVRITTREISKNTFVVNCGHRTVANGRHLASPYQEGEIDFLAIQIVEENTWYIVPLADLRGRVSLSIHSKKHAEPRNSAQWEEAWHLLREGEEPKKRPSRKRPDGKRAAKKQRPGENAGVIDRILACAESEEVWLLARSQGGSDGVATGAGRSSPCGRGARGLSSGR